MAATINPAVGFPANEWTTDWTVSAGVAGQNQMSWGTWEAPMPSPVAKSEAKLVKAPAPLIAPVVVPSASFVTLTPTSLEGWTAVAPDAALKAPVAIQSPPSISPSSFVDVSGQDGWTAAPSSNPSSPRDLNAQLLPLNSPQRSIKLRQAGGNIESEIRQQDLYKTEYCRSWRETGACRYGTKCQFAHGEHELRPVLRHPKYKTEICRNFSETGTCPYGTRCRFVHYQSGRTSNASAAPAVVPEVDEVSTQLSNLTIDQRAQPSVVETKEKPKGSRLPFFQKLRRNTSSEKEKEVKNR
jgi:butyrate response factor 1